MATEPIDTGHSRKMRAMCFIVMDPTRLHDSPLPSPPKPTAERHLSPGCGTRACRPVAPGRLGWCAIAGAYALEAQ